MATRREAWAKAICDTANAGRYLLPGTDVEFSPEFFDGGEVDVQAFLERLDDRGGSVELLASAYWLSQPELQEFVFNDLPVLLRNLGHGSRSSPPSVEPTFRGRVLWPETVMSRLSGAVPRGRYLVQHVEKSADIPENRLLKLFLSRIYAAVQEMAWRGTGALPRRFAKIRDAVSTALNNTYLQGVEQERRIGSRMLVTAQRHRDRRYSRLAKLAQEFDRAVVRGKWGQIVELLKKGWLAPVSSEDLFELYALILVMQAIERDLGFREPYRYGLIQRGRGAVATYRHPDSDVRTEVHFDQVPSGIFGTASEYLHLIGSHSGVTGQERRPDIIVRFRSGASERRVLIEVKETEDPAYIRDSVYKVLGYLRDFSGIWEGLHEQLPKAMVLFPTGITSKGEPSDVILISADEASDIGSALATALDGLVDSVQVAA